MVFLERIKKNDKTNSTHKDNKNIHNNQSNFQNLFDSPFAGKRRKFLFCICVLYHKFCI